MKPVWYPAVYDYLNECMRYFILVNKMEISFDRKTAFMLIFLFHLSAYAQQVEKQVILQESSKDYRFNSGPFYTPPKIADGGNNGFAIAYGDKFIGSNNEFDKKWQVQRQVHKYEGKGMAIATFFLVSNSRKFYDGAYFKSPIGVSGISIAIHDFSDGAMVLKYIPFNKPRGYNIISIFASENGLHFISSEIDSKNNVANQYMCTVDELTGKVLEKKLSLPNSSEEIENIKRWTWEHSEPLHWKAYGTWKGRTLLVKGYSGNNPQTKNDVVNITLALLSSDGKVELLNNDIIEKEDGFKDFAHPVSIIDTLTGIAYTTGYLKGGVGIEGIYCHTYNFVTGKSSKQVYTFSKLNKEMNLVKEKFATIPYAQVTVFDVDMELDPINESVRINLVKRKDLVLKDGYKYLYINKDGKVTEAAQIWIPKGDKIEKEIMYKSKEFLRMPTGFDYFENTFPDDKNKIQGLFLNRNGYQVVVSAFESKSKVMAVKVK